MDKAKILIVEDDNIVSMDIQDVLKISGYDVSAIASSGEEAIKIVEEIQPDLMLMDIVLADDTDGVEVTKQIRDHFDIPVIYLTAHADENTIQRAKVTEPFGYILKPFEETELRTNIEIALHKHRMERKLKEKNWRLATALKSVGDGVIITDINGFVVLMNPAAEVLTGWRHDEALGKDITEVFNVIDEQTRTTDNPIMKALRDGVVVDMPSNVTLVARKGTEISTTYTAVPIRDNRVNINGAVLIFRNINESEGAEIETRKPQTEREDIPIRLMVISSTLFRESIRKILESEKNIEIVAEASTHLEIVLRMEQKRPNVLLIDIALPDLNIAKIMQLVGEKSIQTKVLLLLHTPDEETAINTLLLGVQGYLTSASNTRQLIKAIRAVSKGEIWAERKIITKVIGRLLATRKATLSVKPMLTKREKEIVKLTIQGYSNKQIGNKLFISNQTVKNHLVNIFKKLGISNRLNLILNFAEGISESSPKSLKIPLKL